MEHGSHNGRASGMSVVELLVGLCLMLIVSVAVLQLAEDGRRVFTRQSDRVDMQTAGRAALELIASDVRQAGYTPLGVAFAAVPSGDATHIRLIADLDGDGNVGTAGEANENVSWVFVGPDATGLYELRRGLDLDGDLDFTGTGENIYRVTGGIFPLDRNGDGTDDPFLTYATTPPATPDWVEIAFGIRAESQDVQTGNFDAIPLYSRVALRNRK